jgi:hypothetical protein
VLDEQFLAGAKLVIHMMQRGGYITDYDAHVRRKLANICRRATDIAATRQRQYVLDLARSALSAAKETQERIAFTLKTGARISRSTP